MRLGVGSIDEAKQRCGDEWEEALALSVIDDWSGWRKAGMIAAAVHNAVLMVRAIQGAQIPEDAWKTTDDFVPGERKPAELPSDDFVATQLNALKHGLGL